MRTRYCIISAIVTIVIAAPLHAQSTPTDSARLQGTWDMVSGFANGNVMPAEYVTQMKRVFSGNELAVTLGENTFIKAHVVFRPEQTPRAIDYHMLEGPTAGQTLLGIYEIKGDTAHFAFSSAGANRPADFSSASGDGRTVSTWVKKH